MTPCDVCGNWIHGRPVCEDDDDNPLCVVCMDAAHEAGALLKLGDDGEYHPVPGRVSGDAGGAGEHQT